jgi:hypothetical protein
MSLPLPRLDSRTFDELVRAAVRGVPRRAPAWTDHNLHDPGITLVDLFSWLVEMDLYRLDRIPPAMLRTFLRLVGVEVAPALAARTVLELAHAPGALALPAGIQVDSADGTVLFETTAALFVQPGSIVGLAALHAGVERDLTADLAAGRPIQPWLGTPAVDDAFVLRFDEPLGPPAVSLFVWTGRGAEDWRTRARLVDEHAALVADAEATCPNGAAGVPDWRDHYGVVAVWEYLSPAGWLPLEEVEDETRALSLSGPVRFAGPPDHGSDGTTFPIRCRIVRGAFDCPPRIARIGVNAVEAIHAARIPGEEALGLSSAWAEEAFALARGPVVPGTVGLRVQTASGDEPWSEVEDWDRVGPHDRAFVLDRERGRIVLGNGRVGAVPPAGAALFAEYACGGGAAGNVAAGTLVRGAITERNELLVPGWAAVAAALEVLQPEAAFGGADAETARDAQARAVAWIDLQKRATTLGDYERLAGEVPGVPIDRARAIAEHLPSLPCVPAAGCVTVVAVPRCPAERPEPTEAFLRAVKRWLEPRQMVAAELFVVGPTFAEVTVEATLVLEPNTRAEDLGDRAVDALRGFLHPLHGGPDGDGWPVGRDVHRTEVLELLGALPGVAWVEGLSMTLAGGAVYRCGDVPICPDALVVSGAHRIVVEERRELG